MSDIELALEMLGVGMITVFIILSLVVIIGNLIIRFVNKYLPEEVSRKIEPAGIVSSVDSKKVAAIISAVKMITGGKGQVTKIEKF